VERSFVGVQGLIGTVCVGLQKDFDVLNQQVKYRYVDRVKTIKGMDLENMLGYD
jgi:hypothetical protein